MWAWLRPAERTFSRGGIHPLEFKDLSANCPIEAFVPNSVTIPVSQALGRPAEPTVEKKAKVRKGDVIARIPEDGLCIHATVSGIVKSVQRAPHPVLVTDTAITILAKPEEGPDPEFPANEHWHQLDRGQMLEKLKQGGVVGLGGAAFPTYRKLTLPPDVSVDTLLINGSECEPYLTCDYRLMLEEAEKVVLGAWAIAKIIGVGRCVIGVEDNKPEAAQALSEAIASSALRELQPAVDMEVVMTETKYPQGAERQLIEALTGRVVPRRGLPMHVGIVVQNVATAYACLEAIRHDKPVVDRVVTVSGLGVKQPKNLRVPIGTSVADLFAHCGGMQGEVIKVLSGGPMMGRTLGDLLVPVVKGTSGLLFLTAAETDLDRYQPCVSCGECLNVCPLGLEPNRVSQYVENGRPLETEPFGSLDCFECGCCAYVCPSNRPLVQFMRVAKSAVSSRAARLGK
ncbi:electron transport complex subunit RsxC [Thioflavicoccus mobilis]|nr:electron transport complex subunit RsxC [Thioflavicoccus mobilis]